MKKIFLLSVLGLFLLSPANAFSDDIKLEIDKQLSSFEYYKDVKIGDMKVPGVVEVSFSDDSLVRNEFAVLEKNDYSFKPYYFKIDRKSLEYSLTSNPINHSVSNMTDNDNKTYTKYFLPENGVGRVIIKASTKDNPLVSSVMFTLAKNIKLPDYIEIKSGDEIVLKRTEMKSNVVNFPQTRAKELEIALEHSQQLRINEVKFFQDDIQRITDKILRFLAVPKGEYRIYFNPDRQSNIIGVSESGDLQNDKDILKVSLGKRENNPLYTKADTDGDGVVDELDNCVNVKNPEQIDIDGNKKGDKCDDFDKDGVINDKDNCPNHPNYKQIDTDGDNIGDVCDGEESRITEKFPWLPLAGMGIVALVVAVLFVITLKKK